MISSVWLHSSSGQVFVGLEHPLYCHIPCLFTSHVWFPFRVPLHFMSGAWIHVVSVKHCVRLDSMSAYISCLGMSIPGYVPCLVTSSARLHPVCDYISCLSRFCLGNSSCLLTSLIRLRRFHGMWLHNLNCSSTPSRFQHRFLCLFVVMASTDAVCDLIAVVQPVGRAGGVILNTEQVVLARRFQQSCREQQTSPSRLALSDTPEREHLRKSVHELFGLKGRLDRYEANKSSGRLHNGDHMKAATTTG